MPPSVVDTSPSDWRYVSEGGATIVFSYNGPPNPNFNGTVLRLRKALVPALRTVTREGTVQTGATNEEPDDPTIEYQTKCMSRLIPPEHLPRLETVHLDEPWLERLAAQQNLRRPETRRETDGIDLDRQKGVLATDLVGGDWLAVEIKVRWLCAFTMTALLASNSFQLNPPISFSQNGRLCRRPSTSLLQRRMRRRKRAASACITTFGSLKGTSSR